MVQIFDSWASQLSPQDFEVFSAPYIKQIIQDVRKVLQSIFQNLKPPCCVEGGYAPKNHQIKTAQPANEWLLAVEALPSPHRRSAAADAPGPADHPVHQRQRRPPGAHGRLRPRHHVHRPACGHARCHPAHWPQVCSAGALLPVAVHVQHAEGSWCRAAAVAMLASPGKVAWALRAG